MTHVSRNAQFSSLSLSCSEQHEGTFCLQYLTCKLSPSFFSSRRWLLFSPLTWVLYYTHSHKWPLNNLIYRLVEEKICVVGRTTSEKTATFSLCLSVWGASLLISRLSKTLWGIFSDIIIYLHSGIFTIPHGAIIMSLANNRMMRFVSFGCNLHSLSRKAMLVFITLLEVLLKSI